MTKTLRRSIFENSLVLAISLGGAIWCWHLLDQDIHSKSSAGDRTPAGVLSDRQLNVKRRFGDRLVWDLIDSKETLFWRDSVRTAEHSRAELTLLDGNKITIGESSLVVIEKDNDRLALNLKSGEVVVDNSKVSQNKKAAITVNGKVLEQTGGDKVALQIDEKKGEVTATSSASDGTTKQIIIDKSGNIEERTIPAVLVSPETLSHTFTDSKETPIHFAWQSKKADHRFLELAKDRDFKTVISKSEVSSDGADLTLPPGSYFWRVKLTAKNEETVSEVRNFQIDGTMTPEPVSPAPQSKVSYKTEVAPPVEFTWKPITSATKYLVEIYDDQSFKNVSFKEEVTSPTLKVPSLKEGKHFWRVSALFGDHWKSSSPLALELNHLKEIPPPTLESPEKGFNVTFDYFEQAHGIPFHWISHDGEKYLFTLSRSEDLKNPLVSFEMDQNQTIVHEALTPGTYYWSVSNKDLNDQWKSSEVRKLEVGPLVPLLRAPALVGPEEKSQLDLMENSKVLWSWKPVEGAEQYKFKLIKEESGDKEQVVIDESLKDIRKEKDDLPDGNYKWLVSSVDKFGRESKPIEHQFKVVHGKTLDAPDFDMSEVQ